MAALKHLLRVVYEMEMVVSVAVGCGRSNDLDGA